MYEALALTALGEASLKREGDAARARELVDEALEILPADSDAIAHFDALMARAMIGVWLGSSEDYVRYMERAYVKALDAGRKDLQTIAAQSLASRHIVLLELDEAELLLTRALELAGESGSVRARISATLAYAGFLKVKGELDAAQTMMEEVRGHCGGDRHRARARGSAAEARLARACQGRPEALGEAVPRGAAHHVEPRRSRARARLPGRTGDDVGRAGQDRRGRAAGERRTRSRASPRTRASRSSP